MSISNVCIVGAGAIGSLYGSKLSQVGVSVSVLCRSDYSYVAKHGFDIKSIWGHDTFIPHQVVDNVLDFSVLPDLIIVSTKVDPSINIKELLGRLVDTHCPILLLQNGLFIERPYLEAFPKNPIWTGLAFVCVGREGDGQIHHQDYGALEIGCYSQSVSPLCHELAGLWKESGVPCRVSNTIQKTRWEKLVWNAPFNPLSVIHEATTDELLLNVDIEHRIRSIMKEVCQLALYDGYKLDSDIINLKISQTKNMTPYKTSMLLDFESGKSIESECILGNVLRFSEEKGHPVPKLQKLYDELLFKVANS